MTEGNSSLYFSSGTNFILLTAYDGGLDGVFFDDVWRDMPLDLFVNNIFVFLEALLLKNPVDVLSSTILKLLFVD